MESIRAKTLQNHCNHFLTLCKKWLVVIFLIVNTDLRSQRQCYPFDSACLPCLPMAFSATFSTFSTADATLFISIQFFAFWSLVREVLL